MIRETLSAALFVCLLSAAAHAAIRPSFGAEQLAFEATHVVVVSEGERIDGVVEVLESWTGDLRAGARLEFPELAEFASDGSRTISTLLGNADETDPERVDGSRMLLFLVAEARGETRTFRPAATWGGMRVSTAWLARGRVYGFVQVINPGDAVLTRVEDDESALRARVTTIASEHRRLLEIAAGPDAAVRARDAAPFLHSTNPSLQRLAFTTVADAGEAALPLLRRMLQDDAQLDLHPDVIEALRKAGGSGVVPDLVTIVADETAFWRRTAPDLQRGWWNGTGLEWNDVERLRSRYSRLHAALRALEPLRDARCTAAVTTLRDFWRSLPQLDDRSGLNQMSAACDRVLVATEPR